MSEPPWVEQLEMLLLDLDTIARTRGDVFGACDAIDNEGRPYVSEWAHKIMQKITEKRGVPS